MSVSATSKSASGPIHDSCVRRILVPPPCRAAVVRAGMATHQVSSDSSDGKEEFHSLSVRGEDEAEEEEDATSDVSHDDLMAPPVHPVPQMQAAFEESIIDATEVIEEREEDGDTDAEMRRRRLLEAEHDGDAAVNGWKQRPGATHHPFVKLMAQLVFGMHLLKESQAKSNDEVVLILQGHIDDVDSFLERTAEDFDLAIKDIEERIRYLKLPMQHMDIFNTMLDEKKFRTDLLNGNEKIESIIARTAQAMNAAMHDIHMGIRSTKELNTYLNRIERRWSPENRNIAEVFAAMRGNEQGWMSYLRDLRTKGDNLRNNLVVLETVIGEIAKHAAAASRRNKTQGRQVSVSVQTGQSSPLRSRHTRDTPSQYYKPPGAWLDKPLPNEPKAIPDIKQAAMAKPHPVPLTSRFEQPRRAVPAPQKGSARDSPDAVKTSPHTSSAKGATPRGPTADVKESTQELSNFLRNSGGLRSHPPDSVRDHPPRSQSQGGAYPSSTASNKHFRRSRSQNAFAMSEPRPESRTGTRTRSESQTLPRTEARTDPGPRPQSRQIPCKPVYTAVRDDGTSPAMLRFQIPSVRDSFSRRISQRLKNIPAPLLSMSNTQSSAPAPSKVTAARPIDSAHSSNREKDTHPNVIGHDDSEKELAPGMELQIPFESEKEAIEGDSRIGVHRLFPNFERPLTPLQAARRNHSAADTKDFISSSDSSPQTHTTHSSKVSRTVSLRKFFGSHRRASSRNIMVA